MFLDASPLIALLLGTENVDRAEAILTAVERGRTAVTTTHVLEEVAFKLVMAKASDFLGERNVWRIREQLKRSERLRRECAALLAQFSTYFDTLLRGGLRIVATEADDIRRLPTLLDEHGLLTADSLHLAVMKRTKIADIATFDEDFAGLVGLRVVR